MNPNAFNDAFAFPQLDIRDDHAADSLTMEFDDDEIERALKTVCWNSRDVVQFLKKNQRPHAR